MEIKVLAPTTDCLRARQREGCVSPHTHLSKLDVHFTGKETRSRRGEHVQGLLLNKCLHFQPPNNKHMERSSKAEKPDVLEACVP